MINVDYYLITRDVIRRLINEGHPAAAAKLQDAMDYGSTGTEILMTLQFYLKEIRNSIAVPSELLALISSLIVQLDHALR